MRKLTTALLGLFVLCFAAAPIALADSTSIQSVLFNVNGTPFTDYSAVGMNVGGFDQATGLGTITFTYDPGPTSSTCSSITHSVCRSSMNTVRLTARRQRARAMK